MFQKEKPIDIVDLGCGKGDYIKYLTNLGYNITGYDGNPNTFELSSGVASTLNLTKKNLGLKVFDWVLSLEVGEHIPKCFEQRYLDNICSVANSGLILSWGVPGQSGYGHVNCRPLSYIIEEMEKRNFRYIEHESLLLRSNVTYDWFKNTLMVFKKMQPTHWCRVEMNKSTQKLVQNYIKDKDNLNCLEISGNYWKKYLHNNHYIHLDYPAFDITEINDFSKKYDLILAEQVWEHLKFPYRAMKNVYQMLNEGGAVLITVPFLIQIHNFPGDYTRWTPDGLKYLFIEAGFEEKNIIVDGWGNRQCIHDSFYTPWSIFQPGIHSLVNEKDFPIVVWGLATK